MSFKVPPSANRFVTDYRGFFPAPVGEAEANGAVPVELPRQCAQARPFSAAATMGGASGSVRAGLPQLAAMRRRRRHEVSGGQGTGGGGSVAGDRGSGDGGCYLKYLRVFYLAVSAGWQALQAAMPQD